MEFLKKRKVNKLLKEAQRDKRLVNYEFESDMDGSIEIDIEFNNGDRVYVNNIMNQEERIEALERLLYGRGKGHLNIIK